MSIGASRNVVKSDTPNDKFDWVLVTTTAGSLVIGQEGGNEITLNDVPVGVWLPVGKAQYIATSSTASGLIVA